MKIDRNVPIPKIKHFESKYPFRKMKVGDSFFVKLSINSVGGSVHSFKKYSKSKFKFTCRTEKGGTRVWRIK